MTTTLERITAVPIIYEIDATALTAKVQQYAELTIAGVNDTKGYKAVSEARKELKRDRVAIENRRKELKADALEYGRKVDAMAKRLTALLEPTERRLESEEKRIDDEKERLRKEAELARQRAIQARVDRVVALGVSFEIVKVQALADEEFEAYFAELSDVARQVAERKAEEDRLRREEQRRLREEREAIERERVRLDAERRRLEAEEQANEQAARAALRERESTIPAPAQEPEVIDAEFRVLPEPAVVAEAPDPVVIPLLKEEWLSPSTFAAQSVAAANMVEEWSERYRPSHRRAFLLCVIEELRSRSAKSGKGDS